MSKKGKSNQNETPTAPVEATGEQTQAVVKYSEPNAALKALFKAPTTRNVLDTLQRQNLPRFVKAVENGVEVIPVGGMVSGIIVDVVKSPATTIRGSLLWLHLVDISGEKPVATGIEITMPATGTIRSALARGIDGEEKALEAMKLHKGKLFVAVRESDKLNKKYKKDMTMWDVRLSAEPLDLGVKVR